MADQIAFVSAAGFSLDDFAAIFTASFEGYFYPGTTTAQIMAARLRLEQIDLARSLVMLADGEPAGQAVLALRGRRAWCGGFGIAAARRGRGYARDLIQALIGQAREAGAGEFVLEVLTRNEKAIKAYLRAGLAIVRDLQIFEWKAGDDPAPDLLAGAGVTSAAADTRGPTCGWRVAPAAELLRHFDRLHPVPAAWQRDLPGLLVRPSIEGLALAGSAPDRPAGYVLFNAQDDVARIADIAAESADHAAALLRALQARYARVASVNEPADSPLTAAFAACGFRETDRQHEMALAL